MTKVFEANRSSAAGLSLGGAAARAWGICQGPTNTPPDGSDRGSSGALGLVPSTVWAAPEPGRRPENPSMGL